MNSRTALTLLAGLLLAGEAAAQEPAQVDRVVDVVIAARPEDAAALDLALREPVERQGLRLRWMRVEWFELSDVVLPDPSAPPAAARAWFDLIGISRRAGAAEQPAAVVYLVDGSWDRVLVRTVPLDEGLDEVARQELAEILAAGVEGILAGASPGRPREEVRRELGIEAPVPPPPEPPPIELPPLAPLEPTFGERFSLELGAGYEAAGFSGGSIVAHGFGVSLGLVQRRGDVRFGVSLAGLYRLPIEANGDAVGVRLDVGSIRADVSLDFPFASWFVLRAGLGGGIEIVRVEPRRTRESELQLAPVGYEVAGILEAALRGGFLVADGVALWLGFGVDVDVAPRRYVIDRGGVRDVVLDPWPARPFGSVSVTFDLPAGTRDE